ncbi:FAD-dependent oxidoreductase [Halosolutus amylolyticus]|uniref:FAD-dependent oxidoreductase n=1 Tax=Halosolutus amylolyticus TaxID=2932267 RepID=A0ABD5PTL1_9EURY|nr:FAD-dependent monooxygenase [Halosolutus amylolyticus]
MTLATVPRYDDRLSRVGRRAVVVGAGMAGLVAARVLSDAFDTVTIVDKDPLPDEPVARRGVPQGRQPHLLWEAGRATLDDLFPGYSEELLAAGGVSIDGQRDLRQYSQGGFLASGTTPFRLYLATRPLYEQVVRRRVSRLEGVHVRSRCRCLGYVTDDAATAVQGVTIRNRDGEREDLAADLVVDATGHTSRTPTWLERHGYAPPPIDEVRIDLVYSTIAIERPPNDRRTIGVLAEAPRTRGGAAMPVEGDRWLVNLHGLHGDRPPTDPAAFTAFAASLPTPELTALIEEYPWLSEDVDRYPFPASRRYRYEDLDRLPEGLVVTGDAIASYNPIYGQGMSVAILEGLALHHALAEGGREDLARRFFRRAAAIVDVAWAMAIGADFGFPQTQGRKPRGTAVLNWYLKRLFRTAQTDGTVTDAFVRVLMMEEPPSTLLRPGVAWRVLGPSGSVGKPLRERITGRSDVDE